MQGRFGFGAGVEITVLPVELHIGSAQGQSEQVLAKAAVIVWHEEKPSGDQQPGAQDRECRDDPADATFPEGGKRKCSCAEFPHDVPGDEEAGDHEKDVDPGIPAPEAQLCMKQKHPEDGHGTETVDVRAVA